MHALRVVLHGAGFEVDTTRTAAEALDRGALCRPTAAIIELVLPDGDGVEVCRRLREWSAMPVILLSAVRDEEVQVRAFEAGADDYVTKPFRPRELVARLLAKLRRADPGARNPGTIQQERGTNIRTVGCSRMGTRTGRTNRAAFALDAATAKSVDEDTGPQRQRRHRHGPGYNDGMVYLLIGAGNTKTSHAVHWSGWLLGHGCLDGATRRKFDEACQPGSPAPTNRTQCGTSSLMPHEIDDWDPEELT